MLSEPVKYTLFRNIKYYIGAMIRGFLITSQKTP